MNLHAIVSGQIGAVNPFAPIIIQRSTGYTTSASGQRSPSYSHPRRIAAQIQALAAEDLTQIAGLNIQGEKRGVYINGRTDGLIRQDEKGGDLIITDLPLVSQFLGFMTSNQLIVGEVLSGFLKVGQQVFGDGVIPGTIITRDLTGRSGAGAYNIYPSQTVAGPVFFSFKSKKTTNQITGSISSHTMLVDSTSGQLKAGQVVFGDGVAANTVVAKDLTGNGGPGAYEVSPKQTVPGPALFSIETKVWLNVHVLEYWPDWCKFVITRQDGS